MTLGMTNLIAAVVLLAGTYCIIIRNIAAPNTPKAGQSDLNIIWRILLNIIL